MKWELYHRIRQPLLSIHVLAKAGVIDYSIFNYCLFQNGITVHDQLNLVDFLYHVYIIHDGFFLMNHNL